MTRARLRPIFTMKTSWETGFISVFLCLAQCGAGLQPCDDNPSVHGNFEMPQFSKLNIYPAMYGYGHEQHCAGYIPTASMIHLFEREFIVALRGGNAVSSDQILDRSEDESVSSQQRGRPDVSTFDQIDKYISSSLEGALADPETLASIQGLFTPEQLRVAAKSLSKVYHREYARQERHADLPDSHIEQDVHDNNRDVDEPGEVARESSEAEDEEGRFERPVDRMLRKIAADPDYRAFQTKMELRAATENVTTACPSHQSFALLQAIRLTPARAKSPPHLNLITCRNRIPCILPNSRPGFPALLPGRSGSRLRLFFSERVVLRAGQGLPAALAQMLEAVPGLGLHTAPHAMGCCSSRCVRGMLRVARCAVRVACSVRVRRVVACRLFVVCGL